MQIEFLRIIGHFEEERVFGISTSIDVRDIEPKVIMEE